MNKSKIMADNSNILRFHDFSFLRECSLHKLNQYRKERNLTDVELQIGDKLFPAHRNVLSVASPVLGAMISDQWLKTKICLISDEYVDPEIMEDLLSFLYTGSIELTPDNAHSICVAAHFLQIPTLVNFSAKQLSQLITVENVLTLLLFSNSLSLEFLRRSCLEFIFSNLSKVFQEPQILQLSFKDFTDLIVELKDQCSGTTLREDTFDCVARWTKFSLPERSEAFPVLLENIPLDEVSYRFLAQKIFTHPLVKEYFPCIQNILGLLKLPSFDLDPELSPLTIVIGGRKSEYSSLMNYYHVPSQAWRRLPDMIQKRKDFAVTVSKQRDIFVSGGLVINNGLPRRTKSVEKFCWESHTWQNLPEMPGIDLANHLMAVHNDHLYLVAESSTVWRYSFVEGRWTFVQPMRLRNFGGCLISYKNHLYVIIGGSRIAERYDPIRNEWTLMTSTNKTLVTPIRVTVHGDRIYVSGNGVFEVYNPETDVWTSLPALPENPTNLISLNDKLLAVYCEPQDNDHSIREFNLSTQQWKEYFCQ